MLRDVSISVGYGNSIAPLGLIAVTSIQLNKIIGIFLEKPFRRKKNTENDKYNCCAVSDDFENGYSDKI